MSVNGSDFLDYNEAVNAGFDLIEAGGHDASLGLLIVCGCNLGLRISDLLPLTFEDLSREVVEVREKKTGKIRSLRINNVVREAVAAMPDTPAKQLGGKCFVGRKGSVYSPQNINRRLKGVFDVQGKLITTHSLRKTYARRYFDLNQDTPKVMENLALVLNHSNTMTTRRYLGITQEEIHGIYETVGDSFERKSKIK